MVTPFLITQLAPMKTLSSITIGDGSDDLGSSGWASPSIIRVFAPTLTPFPIRMLLKHQIETPLKPQLLPIIN